MKKPAAKKTTAVKHPFTAAHKREDKIRRLRRELRAAEHSPASPKKTVKVVKAAKKPRAWSPDGDVALCSARAVAEAGRLASGPVLSDADVISLHWAAGGSRNGGVAVSDVLGAVYGLAAFAGTFGRTLGAPELPAYEVEIALHQGVPDLLRQGCHPLILGLDLPWGKPHAVTYDPRDGTWWSWGQPYDRQYFDGAVIEEAWAVTW
jgi:hypothetical protein